MEYIFEFVKDVMSHFDFGYMFAVNIATYFIIKSIDYINGDKKCVPTWAKRITAVITGILIGLGSTILGSNSVVILYSFFVSLVSWDCVFKPILNILNDKFNYKSKN